MVVCYGVFFVSGRSPTLANLRDKPREKPRKPKSGSKAKG
jgi:hypothetical protein